MNYSVRRVVYAFLFAALWFPVHGIAKEFSDIISEFRAQGKPVVAVTPIFNQIVRLSYPAGFNLAYENNSGPQYIQESVLEGESVEKWSQMITLEGIRGLAENPKMTPQLFAELFTEEFQRACPSSFSRKDLGSIKISGYDAFLTLAGCGVVQIGAPMSEIAILIVIKGTKDYYSIKWSEHGPQSNNPPLVNDKKWLARFEQLNPIKLCNRVPNESFPYPSCLNQK
jgi:hypothetical protein